MTTSASRPVPAETAAAGEVPDSRLRVSDAEREPAIERLRQAYAEGRLDRAELDQRLHLAMTARTRADLDAVLADLSPRPSSAASAGARVPAFPDADPTAGQRLLGALAHVLGIVTLFVGPSIMMCTKARR